MACGDVCVGSCWKDALLCTLEGDVAGFAWRWRKNWEECDGGVLQKKWRLVEWVEVRETLVPSFW
jgi:hypothetical protein